VYFKEGANIEEIFDSITKETMLTGWFVLNACDAEARKYPYVDIPYHYIWEKGLWRRRKQGSHRIVTRLLFVQPKERERYALRLLLLNHTGGAQSFRDFRIVDGTVYEHFYDAAAAAGLVRTGSSFVLLSGWSAHSLGVSMCASTPSEVRLGDLTKRAAVCAWAIQPA
jgi:hypothetical protein